jgi:hypothetical protein|tara:strand:+ start:4442 stop:4888 length:447 start_codon:yes stop_codon:yes gene_type:complete
MADGETILPASECPDFFQYVSVTLGADTVDTTGTLDAYIMYCDRDTVVDAAFISFTTVDASNDATFQLQYVPSGLQDTAGVTPVGPEGSGTAITSTTTSGATADASISFTMTESANVVPAGNRIALKVAGTSDIEGVNITLRIRTRRK